MKRKHWLWSRASYIHISKMWKKLGLGVWQKSCELLWDTFKAQPTALVNAMLDELNIERVMVPKNMTHLLQPVHLPKNDAMKQVKNCAFNKFCTDCISRELLKHPGKDITTTRDVDLKLSTWKLKHRNVVREI